MGYLDGKFVPISRASAGSWLKKAAAKDHVGAQNILTELFLQGLVHDGTLFDTNNQGDPDFPNALIWAQRSANAGSAVGQALLAYIFRSGPETMRDDAQARFYYKLSAGGDCPQGHLGYALMLAEEIERDNSDSAPVVHHLSFAAKAGLPVALYLLGVMTEHGIGTTLDLTAAASLYRRAANTGHRAAMRCLGAMLLDGIGVPQNAMEGETYLRQAALAGDVNAAMRVGRLYTASGPLPPNYVEAATWFRRAADGGDRAAAHMLGLMFLNGTGVPPDAEEAARWFRVAGQERAQVDLARLVLNGNGNDDDMRSMLKWFKSDADGGDHVAGMNYAICLAKGFGVERNDVEATHYLRRAARAVPSARYWYGLMLAEGRGVSQNLAKARRHFSLAAEAGNIEAAVALGEMLVNGRGGPRDPERAVTLFRSAASKHAGAMFALGVVQQPGARYSGRPSNGAWMVSFCGAAESRGGAADSGPLPGRGRRRREGRGAGAVLARGRDGVGRGRSRFW